MSEFDVAVVGGGPAGCSAAIHLAHQGARVVLFESRTYPHDKLCGEFLSPECASLLDRLGVGPALRALRPVPIRRVCLTAPDGARWEAPLPGSPLGLSRRALDAALAERAATVGVDLRPGTTVTAIEGDLRSGFTLRTGVAGRGATASAAIAAYGKRSALDRVLARPFFGRSHPFVALKAYFRDLPAPGRIELHGFPGGYCGLSEIEGGASVVCLLAHASAFRRVGGPDRAEAFVDWIKRQNPILAGRLAGARRTLDHWLAIAQIAFEPKSATAGDILMAGDSAGLIAPLAGDGIAMALRSGELAAGHLGAYLAGDPRLARPEQVPARYAAAWQREFGRRLRLARFLQSLMIRPPLMSAALRTLPLWPRLGAYLIDGTRGL